MLDAVSPPSPDAAVSCVWAGIIKVLPAISDASGDSPLAAASSSTLRPSLAATEESDSPDSTRCGNAPDAAAGAVSSAATRTEITPRRRTAGSVSEPAVDTNRCNPPRSVQDCVRAVERLQGAPAEVGAG